MSNKDHGRCFVCGDVAIGVNFGVPTCMPCKAFFRRNALKLGSHEFVCQNDGDCKITYKYRRSCNCCRLAKCFRVGMKKSLILSDEERQARNKLVETNRLKRGKAPKRQCVKWMQPPSLMCLPSSSLKCLPSSSLKCLSPSDQIALSHVFHAYENTCIVAKNTRFQSFPTVPHTSIHEFANEVSPLFQVFIEYFKHIPEFSNLIMDDKVRLVRNHFGTIIHINEPLLYSVTPSNLIITWTNIFNDNITTHLVKRNQVIEQYVCDPIILKVLLIITLLSSSDTRNLDIVDIDHICDDTLSIFAAQNIYVELLWNYILSRSSSEHDAIRYFNKLIMCVLHIQSLDFHIDQFVNSYKNEITQMEPMMQNMWPTSDSDDDINDIDVAQDITL